MPFFYVLHICIYNSDSLQISNNSYLAKDCIKHYPRGKNIRIVNMVYKLYLLIVNEGLGYIFGGLF